MICLPPQQSAAASASLGVREYIIRRRPRIHFRFNDQVMPPVLRGVATVPVPADAARESLPAWGRTEYRQRACEATSIGHGDEAHASTAYARADCQCSRVRRQHIGFRAPSPETV